MLFCGIIILIVVFSAEGTIMYHVINTFWSHRNLNDAVGYLETAARTFDLGPSCRRLTLVNVVGGILVARQVGISPGIYAFNNQGTACSGFDFESLSPNSVMLDGKMTLQGNSGGHVHSTIIGCNARQVIQASGPMSISFGTDGVKVEIAGADNKMRSQRDEAVAMIVVLPEACERFALRNCHVRLANTADGLTVDYYDCTSIPLTLPDVR